MLVSRRAFDGSTRMLQTYRQLVEHAGICRWFSEFRPTRTNHINVVYELLSILNSLGVCCFITGTYVSYLAGLVDQNMSGVMFVVLTNCHIVRPIFKRDVLPFNSSFRINDFLFTLLIEAEDEDELGSITYIVSNETRNFSLYMVFHGVNTSTHTGSASNIDFMYYGSILNVFHSRNTLLCSTLPMTCSSLDLDSWLHNITGR
jgi:hypothetical protein